MRAPPAAGHDWAQIDQIYAVLEVLQPSPVVTLNRALRSRSSRPRRAQMLEPLAQPLAGYSILRRQGGSLKSLAGADEARVAFNQACARAHPCRRPPNQNEPGPPEYMIVCETPRCGLRYLAPTRRCVHPELLTSLNSYATSVTAKSAASRIQALSAQRHLTGYEKCGFGLYLAELRDGHTIGICGLLSATTWTTSMLVRAARELRTRDMRSKRLAP